MMKKLPVIEQATRWIDMFCFFDYSDEVKETAYEILYDNKHKKAYPHMMGAISVYLACIKHDINFKFEMINKVVYAKRSGKTRHPGTRLDIIEKGAKKWKL